MSKPKEANEIATIDTTHELTEGTETDRTPVFVEAEKLFDRMAELTREIGGRAFEFFRMRGGGLGQELEDWFKAERELLRTVPVEITEKDGNVVVSAAVPGFKPEEIEVSVKDDVLIMSGKTEAKQRKSDENVILDEWNSNQFFRQFTLPAPVDPNNVTATLKDGMLELKMPKAAVEEPKKIAVAAG